MLIATDTYKLSHLVKKELWSEMGYTRAVVTVNESAAKTYTVGTVLGKVTASGKHKIAVQTAADGSQNADAIVLADYSVPATTDVKVLVMVRGPAIVSKNALVLDATFDTDAKKAAVYTALEAKGVLVNETI